MAYTQSHREEGLMKLQQIPCWMHDIIHQEIQELLNNPRTKRIAKCELNSVDKLRLVYQPLAEGIIWSTVARNLDDKRTLQFLNRKNLCGIITAEANQIVSYMIAQLR
jgi:hypothetical protein